MQGLIKIFMRLLATLLLGLITFSASPQPKKILLKAIDDSKKSEFIEKFTPKTPDSYSLTIRIDKLNWDKEQVKTGDSFSKIWFKNSLPDGKIGEPELPSIKKIIRIPYGATIQAKVKSYKTEEVSLSEKGINVPIIPVQPPVRKDQAPQLQDFRIKAQAYSKSSFRTIEPIVKTEILGNLRNHTIARVTVYPIEYNPAKGKIKVYNDIEVNVDVKGSPTKNPSADAFYSPYFDVVYNTMLNAGGTAYDSHPDLTRYPVSMLIIANRMFESALQPYIAWKTQKGFKVTTKYTDEIGTTADAIKSFIQNFYNSATPDNPAPTFLVLVGDVEQVPASATGSQSGELTDLYYASVDGDKFPEMYYGRLSATSASQLTAIINKIIYYEQFQFSDPTYLNSVNLIAGVDATWNPAVAQPTIKYATANHFNQTNGWSNIYEYGVDSDPNNATASSGYTGCYDADKVAVGFINYTAHCSEGGWQDPALPISTVNTLTNNQQYPFVIANCCLSANFGYSECVGETWLRKANGGAVTYIGSSPNSYWKEDMYWATGAFPMSGNNNGYVPTFEESTTGAYDAPFGSNYVTAGAIVFCGNIAVTQAEINDYSRQINSTYYWEAYNVLGDPSLMPYFKVPETNQIDFPNVIPKGLTSISIQAKENSYLSLTMDGQILATHFFETTNLNDIAIPELTQTGKIILTVTRPQTQPFIDTIKIIESDNAYITLTGTTINDSEENNNGIADYGEQIKVNLRLKNVGKTNATNVNVKIGSSTGLIALASADSIGISNVNASSELWANDAFSFSIPIDVEDGYQQIFPLTFFADQGVWTSNLKITVSAPEMAFNNFTIVDTLMGNKNGILEKNEIADIEFEFQNKGNSAIADYNVNLVLPDTLLDKVSLTYEPLVDRGFNPSEKTKLFARISSSDKIDIEQIPIIITSTSTSYPLASNQQTTFIPIKIFSEVRMSNDTVETCNAIFTDSGGEESNYGNNEDYTITFKTNSEIEKYRVEVLNFSTESNYDYLYAYDGNSTSSQMFSGSPFSGSTIPSEFSSSTNYVTFRFTSDDNTNSSGWRIKLQCITPTAIPKCVENPSPADNSIDVESTVLSWTPSTDALFYDVYIGTQPESLAYVGRVSQSFIDIKLQPVTTYYWRVIPGNNIGLCDKDCITWSFTTASVLGQVLMTNGTLEVDETWFYDTGGANSNYTNKENYTLTFKPKNNGKINVEFVSFDVESETDCNYDKLTIYNGPDANSPVVGTYCGSNNPQSFTSTSANGELTFNFISDVSETRSGWKAKISSKGSTTTYPITFNIKSNSAPVPNATIKFDNSVKFTNTSGVVEFSKPNGTYSYTITVAGYKSETGTAIVSNQGESININLIKQQAIQLLIKNSSDESYIDLAKVLTETGQSYYSANGLANVDLPVGSNLLKISAQGFIEKDTVINVTDANQLFTVHLTPQSFQTQIYVYNVDETPIENATIQHNTLTYNTNSTGSATLETAYELNLITIQKSGYIDTKFWLNATNDTIINIYLTPIIGNVFETEFTIIGSGPLGNLPLANALVKIFKQGELYQQANALNGHISFYLPSNTFIYEVSHEGYTTSSNNTLTVSNQPQKVEVNLDQLTYTITFLVQSNSKGVEGAEVDLKDYGLKYTDSNGEAIFNNVGYANEIPYTVSHSNYTTITGKISATKSETISIALNPLDTSYEKIDSFSIYPNPTRDYFKILSDIIVSRLTVISINGVELNAYNINSRNKTIYVNNLAPGIYLIKIEFENGTTSFKKLLIQ